MEHDLLEGAAAIAKWLGGKWTTKRVYKAHEQNQLPIRKKPGIGIYAFKSEIDLFLRTA